MAAPFPNLWHLRAVAETSSKACYICYKPTARVLITPNDKDFFYVCPGHLTDPGFASPFVDAEAEAAKAKKAALDREIEQVKQEYEEKQKRKKKKQQKKAKKDDDKDKDKKDDEEDDGKAEKDRDAKIKSIENAQGEAKSEDTPRVYTLHRNFYQMRIDRIRNAEMAKRSQQRVKDPLFFPSAPKGDPHLRGGDGSNGGNGSNEGKRGKQGNRNSQRVPVLLIFAIILRTAYQLSNGLGVLKKRLKF